MGTLLRTPKHSRAFLLLLGLHGTLSALLHRHRQEALDRREWPRTAAENRLLLSVMFTAQATIRDMEKAGRHD